MQKSIKGYKVEMHDCPSCGVRHFKRQKKDVVKKRKSPKKSIFGV